MPVPSALVGRATEAITHAVDARWTMAHAASLGATAPPYLDTTRPGGIVAHPLFAVCVEWPAVTAARHLVDPGVLPREEAVRGVHATHDLVLHRPVRPDEQLTTVATVAAVEARSPGAYQVLRLDTRDADGALVATTHMGSLFLGVTVDGDDRPLVDGPPELPALSDEGRHSVRLATTPVVTDPGLAHTYSECARIWNPIHTDAAVAAAAGLPGPILHGTATLALAVSRVVDVVAGGDPTAVRRVRARFGAMVRPGETVVVRLLHAEPLHPTADGGANGQDGSGDSSSTSTDVGGDGDHQVVHLEVVNETGEPAVRDAAVVVGPPLEHDPAFGA